MIGRWRWPVACVLVMSAFLQASAGGQSRPAQRTSSPPTPEQLGAKVLESVAERAQGFDPPMRAAIEFLIGRTYERSNPAAAEKHLIAAYDTVRYLDDRDQPGIGMLQGEIVAATAVAAPAHVEQMLPGTGFQRDIALSELVKHYVDKKQFEHAIDLYDRMETDAVSVAAERLMMALGPDRADDRTRVFANALNTYRAHTHPYITAGGPEDLGTLVVRFWRDLPPGLVHEAIDELLKQADLKNAPENSQVRKAAMSATGSAGTVTFRSLYEFRLFQLVPILRAIDAPEADKLMKDARGVQQALQLYPQGDSSLDPTLRDTPLKDGETRTATLAIANSGSPMTVASRLELRRRTREQIDAIAGDAADHPQQALTDASAIPDAPLRAQTFLAIARAVARKNTSVANSALKQALAAAKETQLGNRVYFAIQAGQLWVNLGDNDGANSALKVAMAGASDVYENDANPDNPNLALKLYWTSTGSWRDVIALAAKISPQAALEAVKQVPDDEIRAMEEVFLAGIWMKVDPWRDTSPMEARKK